MCALRYEHMTHPGTFHVYDVSKWIHSLIRSYYFQNGFISTHFIVKTFEKQT